MTPTADTAPRVPPLPRLARPVPRAGVVGPAKLALRQYLVDYERDLAGAFRAHADAEVIIAMRTAAIEAVLLYAWQAWLGEGEQAALVAVGGFGRGEQFPASDVDLLILTVPAPDARVLRGIEAFCAGLWDYGIKPGMAVRDVAGCRELAARELDVYTSLLEARPLSGSKALAASLLDALPDAGLWTPQAFLEARQAEKAARHQRYGDTAYNLEPHLKAGPGGLRDLQMIGWLGRALIGSADPRRMREADLLDADEVAALAAARAVLFRIRHGLHLLARHAEERLLFDHQRDLASLLGYEDERADNLGVEQCMQAYYRAVRSIAAINEELLIRCAERLSVAPPPATIALGQGIVRSGDRLDVADGHALEHEAEALIGLYAHMADGSGVKGLRANALRSVRRALGNPSLDFESAPVLGRFRALLERGMAAVDALAAMARHGVLARLIPAFARVTGRMQYDLFHAYTVDEHTLRVLRFMARFASAEGAREFPLAHAILGRLRQPELLLLAGLFHDIAKGRGGDHSLLGEEEARSFCTRLGLRPAATELVAWLVRQHLLMSVTAQRQDITDPAIVHRFAEQVGERERLDYLYLLTVADINGTSPKLWNTWRDRLLTDLHTATRYVLREEAQAPPNAAERIAESRSLARAALQAGGLANEVIDAIWADFPDEHFLRYRPEQIAWQTTTIAAHSGPGAVVGIQPLGVRGTTEVFVRSEDRDGLFATLTAVLDRAHLNVVEARVITARSGQVLDTFHVLDGTGKPVQDAAQVAAIERHLRQALGKRELDERLVRRAVPRTLRHFHVAPTIGFGEVGGRTRVSLVCTDHPGLLAAVAQTFRELALRVHDARIATFGERVEDFFLISDENDCPLDEASRANLRTALLKRLNQRLSPASGAKHVQP